MQRLRTAFAMRGAGADELATCGSLLEREPTGRLMLLPTHHVDEQGDLTGFTYRCSANASGAALPIGRRMFFGHTAGCLFVFFLYVFIYFYHTHGKWQVKWASSGKD